MTITKFYYPKSIFELNLEIENQVKNLQNHIKEYCASVEEVIFAIESPSIGYLKKSAMINNVYEKTGHISITVTSLSNLIYNLPGQHGKSQTYE